MLYAAAACPWQSVTPLSAVHRTGNDQLLSEIARRLGTAGVGAQENLHEHVRNNLGVHHTSIDLIGHTERGAIRVGSWSLREPLSQEDIALFKKIGEHSKDVGDECRSVRFLACGSILSTRARKALSAVRKALSGRLAVEVYGTTVPLDETSFDEEHRRFRDDLPCGSLGKPPKLISLLGDVEAATRELPHSYLVDTAVRQRAWAGRHQWPIVVSTQPADLLTLLRGARTTTTAAEGPPQLELIFLDPSSAARAVRLFLSIDHDDIVASLNERGRPTLRIERRDLRLNNDAVYA